MVYLHFVLSFFNPTMQQQCAFLMQMYCHSSCCRYISHKIFQKFSREHTASICVLKLVMWRLLERIEKCNRLWRVSERWQLACRLSLANSWPNRFWNSCRSAQVCNLRSTCALFGCQLPWTCVDLHWFWSSLHLNTQVGANSSSFELITQAFQNSPIILMVTLLTLLPSICLETNSKLLLH